MSKVLPGPIFINDLRIKVSPIPSPRKPDRRSKKKIKNPGKISSFKYKELIKNKIKAIRPLYLFIQRCPSLFENRVKAIAPKAKQKFAHNV